MQKLKGTDLTAKPSKCEWAKEELVYLGHKIGKGRLSVPKDRAQAIAEYRRPVRKKDARAVLGTASYYGKFIPSFGQVAKPLTLLTRKSKPDKVEWTAGAEQAFTKLCKCICDLCVLTILLSSDTYRLQTDASGAGVGAVLSVVRKGEELRLHIFLGNSMELK